MIVYTFDEMKDKHIGKIGTPRRDKYEYKLKMDLMGEAIRDARKERKLTQEQLGKLVGVQKAQISKIENNAGNATINTLTKIFAALKANIQLHVELPHTTIDI